MVVSAQVDRDMGYRSELRRLLSQHGSDKVGCGYVPVYESVFKRLRHESLRLLEVGIGTMIPDVPSSMRYVFVQDGAYTPGASLRAWRDYFVNAEIYGLDVQPDCMFTAERITTLMCDSLDRAACDAALGDLAFDIVIDDGWHRAEAQVRTFENLWPRVKAGGYYFIEDVHPPLMNEWRRVFEGVAAERWEFSNGQWTFLVFSR